MTSRNLVEFSGSEVLKECDFNYTIGWYSVEIDGENVVGNRERKGGIAITKLGKNVVTFWQNKIRLSHTYSVGHAKRALSRPQRGSASFI